MAEGIDVKETFTHSTVCFPPFHLHVQTSGQSLKVGKLQNKIKPHNFYSYVSKVVGR